LLRQHISSYAKRGGITNKDYLKSVLSYFVSSLIAIAMIIYIGYHLISGLGQDITTVAANIDTYVESITFNAYIMRDEETLYTASNGTLNRLVADGEKVAAGCAVADLYSMGDTNLRAVIGEIDEKIEALVSVTKSASYSLLSDIHKIDAQISEILRRIRKDTAERNIGDTLLASKELLAVINRRQLITGESDGFDDEIVELSRRREELISRMSGLATTVKTTKHGFYFYETDGYEKIFNARKIPDLTVEGFYELINSEPKQNPSEKGFAAGKMVYDYIWYAAVPTERGLLDYFTEGQLYNVTFTGSGTSLSMNLDSIILSESDDDPRAVLIFSSTVMPRGFDYTRMQQISVDVASYTGLRVPLSAIRIENGVRGVYILYGDTVYYRRINIILKREGYVLCSEDPLAGDDSQKDESPEAKIPYLKLYDTIITQGKNLHDGKIIK
jgi:putative membrane fusion protein